MKIAIRRAKRWLNQKPTKAHYCSKVILGASHFTKLNDPCAQAKIEKEDLRRIYSALRICGFWFHWNCNKKQKSVLYSQYKSLIEIVANLGLLGKWTKTVSFKECEGNRTLVQSTNTENAVDWFEWVGCVLMISLLVVICEFCMLRAAMWECHAL